MAIRHFVGTMKMTSKRSETRGGNLGCPVVTQSTTGRGILTVPLLYDVVISRRFAEKRTFQFFGISSLIVTYIFPPGSSVSSNKKKNLSQFPIDDRDTGTGHRTVCHAEDVSRSS